MSTQQHETIKKIHGIIHLAFVLLCITHDDQFMNS